METILTGRVKALGLRQFAPGRGANRTLGRCSKHRYLFGYSRAPQCIVDSGESVVPSHGEFKIGCVICRQAMFPAERLRYVEYGAWGCLIDIDRQTIQVIDEGLSQFGCEPLPSFAYQKGIQNFMSPESRNCDVLAARNPF
jgi:hypothetical protein